MGPSRLNMPGIVCLAIGLSFGATMKVARADIQLRAELDKRFYVSGEEMQLTIVARNAGDRDEPFIRIADLSEPVLDLRLIDVATGRTVLPSGHSTMAEAGLDPMQIPSGGEFVSRFDLHDDLGSPLPPGTYRLTVYYNCPAAKYPEKYKGLHDVAAASNTITLVVGSRSPAEDAEYERYRSVLGATSADEAVRRADVALAEAPRGLFVRRIAMERAAANWRAGRLDQAVRGYEQLAADVSASNQARDYARWNLASIHHSRGDVAKALDAIRPLNSAHARVERIVWERELAALNRKAANP